MNNLGKRIEKLETRTGVGIQESKTWVIIRGEPTYKEAKDHDRIIIVSNEKIKKGVERLLAGESSVFENSVKKREADKW